MTVPNLQICIVFYYSIFKHYLILSNLSFLLSVIKENSYAARAELLDPPVPLLVVHGRHELFEAMVVVS